MCKAISQGGQRCASHARERLTAKASRLEAAIGGSDADAAAKARAEWETAAADYASTTQGHEWLTRTVMGAEAAGDLDTAAMLTTLIHRGEAIRAANRETATLLTAARLTAACPADPALGDPALNDAGPGGAAAVERAAGVAGVDAAQYAPYVATLSGEETPVGWVSARDEAAWDEYVATLKVLSREARTVPVGLGGRQVPAESMLERYAAAERALRDESIRDGDLAAPLAFHQLTSVAYPQFHTHYSGDGHGSEADARATRQRVWNEALQASVPAKAALVRAFLAHPNAGSKTFEAAAEISPGMVVEHPRVPDRVLARVVHHSPETVSAAGWERARERAMVSTGVALSVAATDPDSFQRGEAFNRVMSAGMDTFSPQDRDRLAQNLYRMPCSEDSQVTLATSLVAFARAYGDSVERSRLAEVLRQSKSPRLQALADGAEQRPSEGSRGWFRSRA